MSDVFRQAGTVAPETPREITPDMNQEVAADGRFLRIFGTIYAAVGGGLTLVFGVLAAFALHALIIGAFLGFVFLVTGLVLRGLGKARQKRMLEVFRDGAETEGRVVDVTLQASVRINGRSPFRVAYEYEVDGERRQGLATSWERPDAKAGDAVTVLYMREKPAQSVLWTRFDRVGDGRRSRFAAVDMKEELAAARARVAELEARAEADADGDAVAAAHDRAAR